MVRSSNRNAHHRTSDSLDENRGAIGVGQLADQFSQSSVISISSNDDFITSQASSSREPSASQPNKLTRTNIRASFGSPLEPLKEQSDIDQLVEEDLTHDRMIKKLNYRCSAIAANFDTVVSHLEDCSRQITEATSQCLEALSDNITTTCDKMDVEAKALYKLVSKCDELMVSLRITEDFREEVRALRKSVETLANLYKCRPRPVKQPSR